MDTTLYNLHLRAGQICGKDKTCAGKKPFDEEDAAQRAANAHNRWEGRRHDVEPYPCAFCEQWHIGRIMPIAELEAFITEKSELPPNTKSFDAILAPIRQGFAESGMSEEEALDIFTNELKVIRANRRYDKENKA